MSEERSGRSSSFLHSMREGDHVRFQQEGPQQQGQNSHAHAIINTLVFFFL